MYFIISTNFISAKVNFLIQNEILYLLVIFQSCVITINGINFRIYIKKYTFFDFGKKTFIFKKKIRDLFFKSCSAFFSIFY